ncbi:MAG: ABC transporter permease [Acidobacteria bacterium]|nr:ABC transporter permease [Acidobacteriota bacterium]
MNELLSPPPLAERVLRATIRDAEWRDAVTGDLHEEFVDIARRNGKHAARRWYWRQALGLGARFAVARVVPRAAPRRWQVADADVQPAGGWSIGRDAVYAWRAISHRPGLSAAVVGTLALALAANATVFSLVDALYLRPFRFPGVDRIVLVSSALNNDPDADHSSVAPADFRDWQRESTTIDTLAASTFWDPNMSGVDEPEQVPGFLVTPAFFRVIAAEPLIGRTFLDAEGVPGQDRRVVLSHGLWARRFGSDPAVVGRTIRFDGEPYEVVGVMRPGIALPFGAEVWAPLAWPEDRWSDRTRGGLLVMGRLADGQSVDSARAEMAAIIERQRQTYPDTNARRGATVVSLTRGLADGFAAPLLAIWEAAALLLLVVACANIANLLLARGSERQQEFAVRMALGAGRWRIARQLIFEGAILAGMAVLVTVPLAIVGTGATRQGMPATIQRWVPGIDFITLDTAVLVATMALGAVATVFFACLPALQASRADAALALRDGGRTVIGASGRGWISKGLVVGQVALAVCLVVGAGLVANGLDRAVNGTPGFDRRHVMTAELRLDGRAYEQPEQRRQFVSAVLERLRGMPAVETLAAASSLPYTPASGEPILPEGVALTAAEVQVARVQRVTPAYFDALRIPLLEGRTFTDDDRADTTPVAVVSRSFAERYWPGRSALGRRFRTAQDGPWLEVIGVAGDVVQDLLMNRTVPSVYRAAAQAPTFSTAFVVRASGDPLDVRGELRRAIAAVDPELPVLHLRTMEAVIAERAGGATHLARVLTVMSGIALLLALMGIYSLMSYLASQRTQEFGVRMALGATRGQLVRLSLRHAAAVTTVGIGAGAVLASALNTVMASALFGLVSLDLPAILLMTTAIGAAMIVAGWLPAHRAADLEPTEALRLR